MTLFTIDNSDLKNLAPGLAVKFFRKLLWAEAGRLNISKDLINVPECINVGDGGIDAKLEEVSHSENSTFIKKGTSGYQIKAGNLTPKKCRKELHQNEDLDEPLKPEVKRLLDEGGRYVLVLFADITNQQHRNRKEDLGDELRRLGYDNEYDVFAAAQITSLANQFPSLSIWLKGTGVNCTSYEIWGTDADIQKPQKYVRDKQRDLIINEIRNKIRSKNNLAKTIRIVGLPGIGKTRLIHECLSPDDLNSRVIYTRADSFVNSHASSLLQNNPDFDIILVVDECDISQHDILYKSLSSKPSVEALITLSYDNGRVNEMTDWYELKPLSDEKIKELIKSETQSLDPLTVERISQFADGYPRIATLLVESYLKNPSKKQQNEYIRFNDDILIKRLVGGKITHGVRYENYRKVLRILSIFAKVGFKDNASEEIKWLSSYSGIDLGIIKDVVHDQKKRGIIQGEFYIYVTPHMLKTYLFKEWWDIQDFNQQEFESFITSIPENFREDLFQRFIQQIPLIGDNEKGRKFIGELLSKEGIFKDPQFLKQRTGSAFFLKATEAHPKAAIGYLKRTIGKWDLDEFKDFGHSKTNILWALKRIAIWDDLFIDAARLLVKFILTTNSVYSNTAMGVFQDLFSLGYGHMASSEAPPKKRLIVLEELINSNSIESRRIAYKTCESALTMHLTKTIGAEYQGLKKEPKLWFPETYGDLFDAYRDIWELLSQKIFDLQSKDERKEIAEILLNKARAINQLNTLSETVIETLHNIRNVEAISDKKILETISRILHYDKEKMSREIIEKWKGLRNEIIGNGYSSELKRYVGINLIEDLYDSEGKYNQQELEGKIKILAKKAVADKQLLKENIEWLLSDDSNRSFPYGYYLGKYKNDDSIMGLIWEAYASLSSKNLNLLSGYLKALYEDDIEKFEQLIYELADKNEWVHKLPEILRMVGMTLDISATLRDLIIDEKISVNDIRCYQHAPLNEYLNEDELIAWLRTITEKFDDSDGFIIALRFIDSNYLMRNEGGYKLPKDLTLSVLVSEHLLKDYNVEFHDQMIPYSWQRVCKKFIDTYPSETDVIAHKIVETYGEENSIFSSVNSESGDILKELLNKYPDKTWEILSEKLSPPIDTNTYSLGRWLRGGVFETQSEEPIRLIPPENLFSWVDEDIENRAWFMASFVPPELFIRDDEVCLARQLLIRYGNREDVKRNLSSNFSSGGWTGPESNYLTGKIKTLEVYLKKEVEEVVISWVEERIGMLRKRLHSAQIREDRGH